MTGQACGCKPRELKSGAFVVVLRRPSLSLSLLSAWDCYRYTNHKIVQSLWELWYCWELNDSTSVLGEKSVSRKNA